MADCNCFAAELLKFRNSLAFCAFCILNSPHQQFPFCASKFIWQCSPTISFLYLYIYIYMYLNLSWFSTLLSAFSGNALSSLLLSVLHQFYWLFPSFHSIECTISLAVMPQAAAAEELLPGRLKASPYQLRHWTAVIQCHQRQWNAWVARHDGGFSLDSVANRPCPCRQSIFVLPQIVAISQASLYPTRPRPHSGHVLGLIVLTARAKNF